MIAAEGVKQPVKPSGWSKVTWKCNRFHQSALCIVVRETDQLAYRFVGQGRAESVKKNLSNALWMVTAERNRIVNQPSIAEYTI